MAQPSDSRIHTVTIISGQPGIRKTTFLKKLSKVLSTGNNEKAPQSVVWYDVNNEHKEIQEMKFKDLGTQPIGSIRRIVPFSRENGERKQLDIDKQQEGLFYILKNATNTAIFLDEFNSYCLNTRKVKIISAINRARHKKIDVYIVLHEIDKVTKEMWATAGYYIYFMQMSDIDKSKDKIKLFHLAKIADNIVKEQYEMAAHMLDKKQITKEQCEDFQSFHLEINYFKGKIFGCRDEDAFKRGVFKYLKVTDRYKQIKDVCFEFGWNSKDPKDVAKAFNHLYTMTYKRLWGGK